VLVQASNVTVERDGRRLFWPLDLSIVGPERIALRGPDGSGRTSLIRVILGLEAPATGDIIADRERIALLDQDLAMLDPAESLIDAMRRHNPTMDRRQAHEALAAYAFRNVIAERSTASLSGGERVRLALACLFTRPHPPQMLILDEPTNHLDVAATEMLECALRAYDGAVLCVSHDAGFRAALNLSKEITLAERSR
jgi:ATPase subunit of ABC transporter with duplicated ATPase domains